MKRVQLELFGRLLTGVKDILNDFKLVPIEIKDEAFLSKGEAKFQQTAIPSPGDVIEGMVFEVSTEELLESDKYEPESYRRNKVLPQSGKEAWLYLAYEDD